MTRQSPRPAEAREATAPTPPPSRAHALAAEDLRYPAGSLVLLAGLPGAGKSTLLDRLYGLRGDEKEPVRADGAWVIDSRQARNWWAPHLRVLPPRIRIPFVYATHVWRISRVLLGGGHGTVAHTRGTWPHILYGFAWLARRAGGEVHLILLDVDPEVAREGQVARGRVVTDATFARHCRRWRSIVGRARDGALPPAAGVTVLDRPGADRLRAIRFDERRAA
ncbi:energy-coupling factor transporter ATP-binding protein EcfA2 [Streptosporangium becharense]|uniref:Energy-coupling factor transporter ATP-binding protein EcfA2 n=1 Tax=Streptosporangium becharense TaxID=1816182 RepID=A0A7W9MJP8_9ACTN|nr:ATP-binding protein [Streptosporangium becharense]MBB2910183.1 energy-coupling factor transporter ATP-binding protein EcfA2 [Streptosporangium becharense]MBB5822926.1 energy-coupling factor transporter ATP-binding protein EcfA2 [Streptosporangium becharense]